MVAFATASAAANNTASAEWRCLLVMLCVLCPTSWRASARSSRDRRRDWQSCVAENMRRDVGWQISQLGDPQPHLPIADDGHLAGSTGEHHIADHRLGLDHGAGQFRQGAERCAGLGIGQPCSSSWQIDLRPSQTRHLAATPSRQDHQPCGGDGWLPDLCRLQCPPKLPVLIIGQTSLSPTLGELDDAMHRGCRSECPGARRR
jgi:hypothetical protein